MFDFSTDVPRGSKRLASHSAETVESLGIGFFKRRKRFDRPREKNNSRKSSQPTSIVHSELSSINCFQKFVRRDVIVVFEKVCGAVSER
ncbi:hypothetical protein Bhyg_03282 [Pseudolycoriella hygida]|uniref:Uncharacterized protein n=1 Tax=Pseudolycoriella hygida TaxID=35572 RepID=A0A9Q0NDU9_9DIPT|nr:hypothetical protein Bhyg_03282 [Pseudolycoriella hygida]